MCSDCLNRIRLFHQDLACFKAVDPLTDCERRCLAFKTNLFADTLTQIMSSDHGFNVSVLRELGAVIERLVSIIHLSKIRPVNQLKHSTRKLFKLFETYVTQAIPFTKYSRQQLDEKIETSAQILFNNDPEKDEVWTTAIVPLSLPHSFWVGMESNPLIGLKKSENISLNLSKCSSTAQCVSRGGVVVACRIPNEATISYSLKKNKDFCVSQVNVKGVVEVVMPKCLQVELKDAQCDVKLDKYDVETYNFIQTLRACSLLDLEKVAITRQIFDSCSSFDLGIILKLLQEFFENVKTRLRPKTHMILKTCWRQCFTTIVSNVFPMDVVDLIRKFIF